jgi:hypothetical protein
MAGISIAETEAEKEFKQLLQAADDRWHDGLLFDALREVSSLKLWRIRDEKARSTGFCYWDQAQRRWENSHYPFTGHRDLDCEKGPVPHW